MKRFGLLLLLFAAGFFTHAWITPNLFSRTPNIEAEKNKLLGDKPSESDREEIKALTTVSFKDGSFHPGKVFIKKGYYVAIRNDNPKEQMWLSSNLPELSTIRGYQLSEQVKAILPQEGTYVVVEKQTGKELIVVVQP